MEWNNPTRPILQCNHSGIRLRPMYTGRDVSIHFRSRLSIRNLWNENFCVRNVMQHQPNDDKAYVMSSIFHSSPASRRRFRSCIVRELSSVHRMSIVRRELQSSRRCSGIATTHICRWVRSLSCRRPVSSRVQSSGDRKHTSRSPNRSVHGPSIPASTDKPAGRELRNLHLASQPCRSTGRRRSYRDLSTMDLGSQLFGRDLN